MAIISLNVKVGQAVRIGDVACIGVAERKGAQVKLNISTNIRPVELIASGIFPPQFQAPGIQRNPLGDPSRHQLRVVG